MTETQQTAELLEAALDAAIAALESPPEAIQDSAAARIAGRVAHLRELCNDWLRADE